MALLTGGDIKMELVIAGATKSSDAQILARVFATRRPIHVRAILVTPLMVNSSTLRLVRKLHEDHEVPVLFDSGGYAVQTGRLDYFEMYSRLIELYRRERWASFYTLPDNVPTSRDGAEDAEAKIQQTVTCSEMFYREMPAELRDRALPVVHGRTVAQVEHCLDRYARLGVRHVGFGSFGTAGEKNAVNIATGAALAHARRLAGLAAERAMTTHLFGVGSPAIFPLIARTGATSFDSANWARSAGYGQVFLPLTRGYNVTHRSTVSTIQRGLTREQFARLRANSDHVCPYCESFEVLQTSREARAGHNLLATVDAVDIVRQRDHTRMDAIYNSASPRYRALWQRWREGG